MGLYRFLASDRVFKDYQELDEMKIISSNDMTIASNYTTKKNCAYLEWDYNENNAEKLISYIKEHLRICPRIELWCTNNKSTEDVIVSKCSKHILTKEKIKEVLGKDITEQPRCLVVYNS